VGGGARALKVPAEQRGCWLQAEALKLGPTGCASKLVTRGRQLFWDAKTPGKACALIGLGLARPTGRRSQRKMWRWCKEPLLKPTPAVVWVSRPPGRPQAEAAQQKGRLIPGTILAPLISSEEWLPELTGDPRWIPQR